MLNERAAEMSRQALPIQLDYLHKSYPFFRALNVTDSSYTGEDAVCAKMDYFNGIDCYAHDLEGRNYNVQLKVRQQANDDLIFIARKITDADMIRNPHIGFTFNGCKYTFILKNIDLFCEMINGKIYNVRATDLMALEYDTAGNNNPFITDVRPQEYYDASGEKFFSGNYYVFISVDKMMEIKQRLLMAENRDYYNEHQDCQDQ